MAEYVLGFILSSIFMYLSEKTHIFVFPSHSHKCNTISLKINFFGSLAIATITIMSAIRALHIGTDMNFYVLRHYEKALFFDSNVLGYFSDNPDQVEPLYLLIEYISAYVFSNVHFALFSFSLITNSFIYLGIKNLKGKIDVTFGWIVYCLAFYSITLNLMRQFMSIAIIFFLFSDEIKLSWKRTIILSILAMGFHVSGVLGIFLYTVYRILNSRRLKQFKFNKQKLIVWGLGLCFMLIPFLLNTSIYVLWNIGIIHGKYQVYLDNTGQIAFGNILFRSVFFLLFALYLHLNKHELKNDKWLVFVLYISVVDILFLINNGLISVRIGKYFSIFEIVYFSIGLRVINSRKGRLILWLCLVCLLFSFWYYQFVILNSGDVYPYSVDSDLF